LGLSLISLSSFSICSTSAAIFLLPHSLFFPQKRWTVSSGKISVKDCYQMVV
jgi:hypothetical protein